MYYVTLYFSNWYNSWSTTDFFKTIEESLDFVSKFSTPDLQTVSIVKRGKKI